MWLFFIITCTSIVTLEKNTMLRPQKFINPKYTLLNLGAYIISCFSSSAIISYSELQIMFTKQFGIEVIVLFHPTLSFLFLLGKIDFVEERNSFTLRK